jgi:hypothetical protein
MQHSLKEATSVSEVEVSPLFHSNSKSTWYSTATRNKSVASSWQVHENCAII